MRTYFLAPLLLLSSLAVNAAELKPQASPETQSDYRSRTVYFLMTDRFNPHQPYAPYVDPAYPTATNSVNCFVVTCTDEVEFRSYWGGDIQGIIQKMNYLNDLGVSAVWVTPLMENVRAYDFNGYGTGYHGYWVQNYYRVNPHFGGWGDVNALSQALHAKGMRYIQDITLNHSNPSQDHTFGELFQSQTADQTFIPSYENDYDAATGQRFYKHYEDTHQCKTASSLPDSQWNYWQLHHCLLAKLSGYNQQDPTMANYLLGAGKLWVDHGVDDFRLDAVKFPFPEFIATFTHEMEDHLASLHRPAPYIVGEWSNGGVGDQKSLQFEKKFDYFQTNLLDFQTSFRLNRFIGGAYEVGEQNLLSADQLNSFLEERVKAFKGRDTWQGTFLDNHDEIRTLGRLKIIGITDEAERKQRMDLGSVLLMTIRGIPIIYYGDEQYLVFDTADLTAPPDVNTGNDDPYNRVGLNRWDETTPAFKILSTLAKLRKENSAIWQGDYVPVYAQGDVLIYERVDGNNVVLIAVNRGEARDIVLSGNLKMNQGVQRGLLEGSSAVNQGNYLEVSGNKSRIHLNKLSSMVIAR